MSIRSRHRSRIAALVAVLAIVATSATTAVSPARAAEPGGPPADDQVLIRYAPGTSTAERRAITRGLGVTPVRASPDGRSEVVDAGGRATATIRREIRDDPRVVAVAPNERRELAEDAASEPAIGELWGLHNTGQRLVGTLAQTGVPDVDIDGLQALLAGIGDPGVVVAVIDDGVDFGHPDLAARAWTNPGEAGAKATNGIDDDGNGYVDDVHGWDFCNDDNTLHDPEADGHGTHVAGTIAASLDGAGVVGVAPGISVMALKFIDDSWDCGRDDMAVRAIDYAASFGVRIINASWGGPRPSAVLDAAIAESGALLVAAAGNSGADLDRTGGVRFYPASSTLPNVIAVGAIDQRGARASFSNFGATSVDIVAPGTNVLSTYPAYAGCPSPCYAWSAGTSMAAPHVSGVAALVGSHRPTLLADPLVLRGRLLATGRPLAAAAATTSSGRLVNALRAIDAVKPQVKAPDRYAVPVNTIVGTRSVPIRVRWPAATDDLTGVASYAVRRSGPEGWTATRTLTGTSLTSTLRTGASYRFRLRATDRAGNVGGPVDGPTVTAKLFGDGTSLATYGAGWKTTASSGATGRALHTSTRSGAWMSFTFTGRSVALVAPKGASRGSVKIYVDGVYDSTVSLYRSSPISRVVVFSKAWTTRAAHTIRLVVVGTKGHPRVDVDGFIVVR
jgi:subtilisin family serine protease